MTDKFVPEGLPDGEDPTSEELRSAQTLRESLEEGAEDTEGLAQLARSLRAAHEPTDLSSGEHRALVERALGGGRAVRSGVVTPIRRGTVLGRAFAVSTTGLALAAGVAFVLRSYSGGATQAPSAALIPSRSTESLFREPFEAGKGSARIDRIVLARSADLRENRFRRWGVR